MERSDGIVVVAGILCACIVAAILLALNQGSGNGARDRASIGLRGTIVSVRSQNMLELRVAAPWKEGAWETMLLDATNARVAVRAFNYYEGIAYRLIPYREAYLSPALAGRAVSVYVSPGHTLQAEGIIIEP